MSEQYVRIAKWSGIGDGNGREFTAEEVIAHLTSTERERDKAVGGIEKLGNIIHGRQWLAEGRGSYAAHDGHYDEEVQRFVQELVEALEPGRWEPWQTVLSRLRAYELPAPQEQAGQEAREEPDTEEVRG